MRKIKLTISLFILSLFISVKSVAAGTVYLSITDLPDYITTNSFKLSYSCLGCTSVQFYVSKNGGSWNSFGSLMTDASGQVQVTSSQVDEQTSYAFKVVDASGEEAKTETFYDISGPSPVSGYYKDSWGVGFYKLHWTNPTDSDFAKVIIYRGDTSSFSADASHEIAQVPGGAGATMTYDEHQPDSSKTYYYALRALDKAGNSSSLVGDAGTTVLGTSTQATATPGTSSKVVSLPKEEVGQVLPESTGIPEEASEAPRGVVNQVVQFAKNRTKLTVLILAGLGLAGYLLYRKARKS